MVRPQTRPAVGVGEHLFSGQTGDWFPASQMLAHKEAHARVSNITDNVWQGSDRRLEAVFPGQFHVGHQKPTAAVKAEARLEGHEDPRRLFVAGNALAVEEFDPRDGAAITIVSQSVFQHKQHGLPSPQAHVLGERPARQAVVEPPPERCVVQIMEPH